MYHYEQAGKTGGSLLYRDPADIRLETERLKGHLRAVREKLSALSAAHTEIADSIEEKGENEGVLLLFEILLDAIEDAESEARSLLYELSRLEEELKDSLWLLNREEDAV